MPKLPRSTSSATSSMASGTIPSRPAKPHPDRLKIMHLFPDRPLDHVTIRRRVSEPMRPISVRRVVTDGSSERGTTTGRCTTDGSRTAPYYRGSHRRRRGDGEKGAAGRDHDGAGEGPDTALATLAAEPPACE